ncbi:MAG: hypothetical protein IEMM0003_0388 [bacterium]|nr:MAG: hypothetical protein IEMM0003_0388 [bacterium]
MMRNIENNLSKEIAIYEAGDKKIEVSLKKESIWLDAHRIAYLLDVDRTVIVKHIQNIYKSLELSEELTCAKIAQVAADGKKDSEFGAIVRLKEINVEIHFEDRSGIFSLSYSKVNKNVNHSAYK